MVIAIYSSAAAISPDTWCDMITETILGEFYDRDERQTVYLILRESPGRKWYVIRQGDSAHVVGYNREDQARERFRQLRGMICV